MQLPPVRVQWFPAEGHVLPDSPAGVSQVAARGLARVVVFEDDVRFESNFKRRLERLMEEVEAQELAWDLM